MNFMNKMDNQINPRDVACLSSKISEEWILPMVYERVTLYKGKLNPPHHRLVVVAVRIMICFIKRW